MLLFFTNVNRLWWKSRPKVFCTNDARCRKKTNLTSGAKADKKKLSFAPAVHQVGKMTRLRFLSIRMERNFIMLLFFTNENRHKRKSRTKVLYLSAGKPSLE